MSVTDMRTYVANGALGPEAAADQIELLTAQRDRLEVEAEHVALRARYVQLKIDYWHAVQAGDDAEVERLSGEAAAMAAELKHTKKH